MEKHQYQPWGAGGTEGRSCIQDQPGLQRKVNQRKARDFAADRNYSRNLQEVKVQST